LCVLIGSAAVKPKLRVASDGFPTGQETPEGVAGDLARAFVMRDADWFRRVACSTYGAGKSLSEYAQHLEGVSENLKLRKGSTAPDDPHKILKVFAARHLSKKGPASYGYAGFVFQDVLFVDVEVLFRNGSNHLRRTMVIQDRDGKWYVHPAPDVSPLLCDGLYDESASVQLFTNVNDVRY
jgi:hypothetical protein